MHQPLCRSLSETGHGQRIGHDICRHARLQRPAVDFVVKQIEHNGKVQPAFVGPQVPLGCATESLGRGLSRNWSVLTYAWTSKHGTDQSARPAQGCRRALRQVSQTRRTALVTVFPPPPSGKEENCLTSTQASDNAFFWSALSSGAACASAHAEARSSKCFRAQSVIGESTCASSKERCAPSIRRGRPVQ